MKLSEFTSALKEFDDRIAKEINNFNTAEWQVPLYMTTNIFESKTKYEMRVAIPGVLKEQIKLKSEYGVLSIKVNSVRDIDKTLKIIREERLKSLMMRQFTIPQIVDLEKITSEYVNGILIIHLPKLKRPPHRPTIQIKIN